MLQKLNIESCDPLRNNTPARFPVCAIIVVIWVASSSGAAGDLYLRGSIALDRFNDTVFTDTYCPSGTPAALYGCGTGRDDLPYSTKGGFDQFPSIEVGLGLSTLSNMRFEFLVEYQPNAEFKGNANFLDPDQQQSVTAKLSSLSSSFVSYLDFPRLSLFSKEKFVPYVGAGFGITRNRIETTTMTFPVTTTIVPGASETRLMWTASVGVTMALNEAAKFDLGLRYEDRSKVRTGHGEGSVNWRNGARGPLSLDLARTEAELRGFSLRLSFRYSP